MSREIEEEKKQQHFKLTCVCGIKFTIDFIFSLTGLTHCCHCLFFGHSVVRFLSNDKRCNFREMVKTQIKCIAYLEIVKFQRTNSLADRYILRVSCTYQYTRIFLSQLVAHSNLLTEVQVNYILCCITQVYGIMPHNIIIFVLFTLCCCLQETALPCVCAVRAFARRKQYSE